MYSVRMCELSFGSFNAKCVFPVDRSMQGRCRDSPPASVPSSAQHICIHESKHLRVRMHVLLAECIESWVAFVCFSVEEGKKKPRKKRKISSHTETSMLGGFSEVKEKKKQQQNTKKKNLF